MKGNRTYLRLRSFLRTNVPGLDNFYLGQGAIGFVLLGYFLLFPLLILWQWTLVWDGMTSLALSIFFLITNPDLHPILLRGEVIEHWTASLFVLAMPVLLWNLTRRRRSELIRYKDEHEMSQWNLAWREFRKNKIAAGGLVVILLMYTVAFLCPLLAPYHPNEFQDGVVTKFQPPLSSATILYLKEDRIPKMVPTALRNQTDFPREFERLMRINDELTFSSFFPGNEPSMRSASRERMSWRPWDVNSWRYGSRACRGVTLHSLRGIGFIFWAPTATAAIC